MTDQPLDRSEMARLRGLELGGTQPGTGLPMRESYKRFHAVFSGRHSSNLTVASSAA